MVFAENVQKSQIASHLKGFDSVFKVQMKVDECPHQLQFRSKNNFNVLGPPHDLRSRNSWPLSV